jgi:hypothetical protein
MARPMEEMPLSFRRWGDILLTLNLSGFWSGRYWYNDALDPDAAFIMVLRDEGAKFSGEITEPNMVGISSDFLRAVVTGTRSGQSVEFAKVYDGASDLAHRVDYFGSLSEDGLKLTGYWLLEQFSGGFEATRAALPEETEEMETAESVGASSTIHERMIP